MKSSGISSAYPAPQLSVASPRKTFALTGRSALLDPSTHAVRGDLADVRLAEHVFAPHYAAPLPCVATRAVNVVATRDPLSQIVAELAIGDPFEVLELAGGNAWGIAPGPALVGYVDRTALDVATA